MKSLLVLCLAFVFYSSSSLIAQIPNAGFENWTSGNPDNWLTGNSDPVFPITQTSDAHSGSSAVQGEVLDVSGFAFPPYLVSGPDGAGFPFNTRPASIHGFYKFTSINDDYLEVIFLFTKNGTAIGGGIADFGAASSYTEFSSDITWIDPSNPDTAYIAFYIVNASSQTNIGSTFILDDLSYSNVTAIQPVDNAPAVFELAQNYPNPFNPSTVISYTIPKESFVSLKVYNLLGQEVASLVNKEQSSGTYKVDFSGTGLNLTSGIYLYTLKAGSFVQTRKMMLLK
ncbi:MAG TPA: T9SS type A sorting domain-containing protein [Ignavibacteriaceae bacterium]